MLHRCNTVQQVLQPIPQVNQLTRDAACVIMVLWDDKSQLDNEEIEMIKMTGAHLAEVDKLAVVEGEPIWWDEEELINMNKMENKRSHHLDTGYLIKKYLPTIVVVTILLAWTSIVWVASSWYTRAATENRMASEYAQQLESFKEEQERMAQEAIAMDPYTKQLNAEAEIIARVLYGVKDNDDSDLKTYCWCVFNRVDNNSYPSTIEDVVAQPNQWMRYDETNPILEDLYQIAREQLNEWHTNTHRPCSSDYVFMNWSANDICLRDNFYEGSGTHYWRWKQ